MMMKTILKKLLYERDQNKTRRPVDFGLVEKMKAWIVRCAPTLVSWPRYKNQRSEFIKIAIFNWHAWIFII